MPIAEMFFEVVSKEGGAIIDSTFGVKKKKVEPNEPNGGEEKEKADGADDEDAESVEAENKSRLRNGGDTNHALVCNLIALHAKYNGIVDNCFEKNQIFDKSLKKAFDEFINRDERVSKLLAQFVNEALKKGNKLGLTDVESVLENVVFLYGYIRQKDVFERDYQTFLAQRLLEGLCESEHSEKSMIAKLKNQCGKLFLQSFQNYCPLDFVLTYLLFLLLRLFVDEQARGYVQGCASQQRDGFPVQEVIRVNSIAGCIWIASSSR